MANTKKENPLIKRLYIGEIEDWWTFLKPKIQEQLTQMDEVVVIDNRFKNGRELISLFLPTKETNDDPALFLVSINKKGTISKIEIIMANPKNNGKLDNMLKENEGIVRING